MFSRIGIICFAASYAIVLALEISRLVFRSGVRGAFMVGWAAAGLLAHSIYLYNEAVGGSGVPLSSWRDWFLVAAWFLMIVYLYLVYYHPRNMLGVFLLPLVLGLIGMASFVVGATPFARQPASQIWGGIHGASLGLAAAAMLFGFALGMMYLRQDHRLKNKIPPDAGLKLPSLEWLQNAAVRSMVGAVVFLGIGVLTGMLLNTIDRRESGDRLRWFDPLVLGSTLLFFWLLFTVHVSYLFRHARRGRVIAYLAVTNFVVFAVVLAAGLLLNSQHGRSGERGEGRGECKERVTRNVGRELKPDCKYMTREPLSTLHSPLSTASSVFPLPTSPFVSLPSPLIPLPCDAFPSRRL